MPRVRKSRKDLPLRVYVKHNAYYYISPNNKWLRLAAVGEEQKMRTEWAKLFAPENLTMNVAGMIEDYLCKYAAKNKAPRTYKDNLKESVYLKAFFGEMRPQDLMPKHIKSYLNANAEARPIRANREKALLSHIFTWASQTDPWATLVTSNPCMRVAKNPESKRMRLVDDQEYIAVYNQAHKNVKRLMTLIYQTLQRPSDLLLLQKKNIIKKKIDGDLLSVLRVEQGKTGAIVEIIINEELFKALIPKGDITTLKDNDYLITNRMGNPYTYDGINSNFKNALNKYRNLAKKETGIKPVSFGIYDIKSKGITDMYQNGVPIEQIQVLAAHESVRTTEIYIKQRLLKPVHANSRKIIA